MAGLKYTGQFPKNYMEVLIYNELGEELLQELEAAGCELEISEDSRQFGFTNITPELKIKVAAKQLEAYDKYVKFFMF